MAFFESSGSSFSFEGFLALTVVAALWLYYIIFFNSRLWGLVVTLILRKLVRGAYVRVGKWFLRRCWVCGKLWVVDNL